MEQEGHPQQRGPAADHDAAAAALREVSGTVAPPPPAPAPADAPCSTAACASCMVQHIINALNKHTCFKTQEAEGSEPDEQLTDAGDGSSSADDSEGGGGAGIDLAAAGGAAGMGSDWDALVAAAEEYMHTGKASSQLRRWV